MRNVAVQGETRSKCSCECHGRVAERQGAERVADSRRDLQLCAKRAGGIKYQLGHGGDWSERHLLVDGVRWSRRELVLVQQSQIDVDVVSEWIIKTCRGRVCKNSTDDGVVHGEGKVNVTVVNPEAEKGVVVAVDRPD